LVINVWPGIIRATALKNYCEKVYCEKVQSNREILNHVSAAVRIVNETVHVSCP